MSPFISAEKKEITTKVDFCGSRSYFNILFTYLFFWTLARLKRHREIRKRREPRPKKIYSHLIIIDFSPPKTFLKNFPRVMFIFQPIIILWRVRDSGTKIIEILRGAPKKIKILGPPPV